MLLPAINLSLFKMALMIRLARAGTREVMLTDTVKFARAAGQSERTMLRRHVLRLISIPLVTVFGLELGSTLAFAVVTETIFSWPGVGKLIIDSINALDRPVMVAYLMLVALLFIIINLLVDLANAALDPRIRCARALMRYSEPARRRRSTEPLAAAAVLVRVPRRTASRWFRSRSSC